MGKLLALVWCFTVLSCRAEDLPADIRLTNGAIMRNCTVLRWQRDAILVKSADGTAPIRYGQIHPEQRPIFENALRRKLGRQAEPADLRANVENEAGRQAMKKRLAEKITSEVGYKHLTGSPPPASSSPRGRPR